MTREEFEALKSWIDQRPAMPHVCTFAGLPNAPETKDPVFECVHGKRLTWGEARRALGLPV